MSVLVDASTVTRRFDALCSLVRVRGRRITFDDLGDAYALAKTLEEPEPDQKRVAELAIRLGLDPAEVPRA